MTERVFYKTYEEAKQAEVALPSQTVWLTKYALTDGITIVHNVRECYRIHCSDSLEGFYLVALNMVDVKGIYYHRLGRDWHTTEAAALARVEKMLAAKRKTLQKQLDKLSKLSPATIKRHEVTVEGLSRHEHR